MAEDVTINDVLSFKAFKPVPEDGSVSYSARFGKSHICGVHFGVDQYELFTLRGGKISDIDVCPYNMDEDHFTIGAYARKRGLKHIAIWDARRFEVEHIQRLKDESVIPEGAKVVVVGAKAPQIIPKGNSGRIYIMRKVGEDWIAVSHMRENLRQVLDIVEKAGLTVVGLQSSAFSIVNEMIESHPKDGQQVSANGSGSILLTWAGNEIAVIDGVRFSNVQSSRDEQEIWLRETWMDFNAEQVEKMANPKMEILIGKSWSDPFYYDVTPIPREFNPRMPFTGYPVVVGLWLAMIFLAGSILMSMWDAGGAMVEIRKLEKQKEALEVVKSERATRLQSYEQDMEYAKRIGRWVNRNVPASEVVKAVAEHIPASTSIQQIAILSRDTKGPTTITVETYEGDDSAGNAEFHRNLLGDLRKIGFKSGNTSSQGNRFSLVDTISGIEFGESEVAQ